ncbi:hypothetical protein CBOM_00005 [Ceraceosorus bombacis]|uniref:Uncharacterized protein n=1 Tax=Ceraceosorus bombacis TaxID=401625 RepID=A0A0P1B9N2_9BASI|nr:hypothetical protein CBOM_00005 [Ceraceosorus bombacis]
MAALPPELQVLIADLAAQHDRLTALALLTTSKLLSPSGVKGLFEHPFLHTLAQVQSFTAALQRPQLKPLVKSLAIEDRYLNHSTSLARFPDAWQPPEEGPDERETATYRLCELIEELVTVHNLSALALTVTGARNFLDIMEMQRSLMKQYRKAPPFSQRLAIDKLAITGSDIQSNFLFDWFLPRQLNLYVCDDSLWGMGTHNCMFFALEEADPSPELVLSVGNVDAEGEAAAVEALLPLFKKAQDAREGVRSAGVRSRVVLRLRRNLVCRKAVEPVIARAQGRSRYELRYASWDTREAKTQLEAEQLDFCSGAWRQVAWGGHDARARDGARDVASDQDHARDDADALVGPLEGWSNDAYNDVTPEDDEEYVHTEAELDRRRAEMDDIWIALAQPGRAPQDSAPQ